jgi:hypothetical protein
MIYSNLLKFDICVKNERVFCEGACSKQKPLLVSKNSSPPFQKLLLKIRTKTGKT